MKKIFLCLFTVLLLFLCLHIQHPFVNRPSNACEDYPGLHSTQDMDHDGIDDQTDIIQSALTYINTRPKYKSRYYADGWPDDGYGTCADVVTNALLGAGYDLQVLVDQDIRETPCAYDVPAPDAHIDFRRVRNLNVWFMRHAQILSTSLSDPSQWQGGDIVVFHEHIGIVSDRRNAQGIPYVLHHAGPLQWAYEEDILKKRTDIQGHYRIG